jgi:hypothetical protein
MTGQDTGWAAAIDSRLPTCRLPGRHRIRGTIATTISSLPGQRPAG